MQVLPLHEGNCSPEFWDNSPIVFTLEAVYRHSLDAWYPICGHTVDPLHVPPWPCFETKCAGNLVFRNELGNTRETLRTEMREATSVRKC